MNPKRFIVELGWGVDMHGQDATKAACRAVQDAISRSCLCGLMEILDIKDLNAIEVEIAVAVPWPEQVDKEAVAQVVPIGKKTVKVVPGGMLAPGIFLSERGDRTDQMVIANAAVTVLVP